MYWAESKDFQVERRWTSYFGGANRSRGMELSLLLEDRLQFGKRDVRTRVRRRGTRKAECRGTSARHGSLCHTQGLEFSGRYGTVARLGQICVL